MTFYVINSSNSIYNTDDTPLGGTGLQLGLGDGAVVQADGTIVASGAAGTGIYVNGYADSSTVVVNGFVYGTSSGILSLGQYAQITVNGQVNAKYTGVSIANGGDLYVSSSGVVSGSEGVALNGATLVNDGTVNGIGSDAVQISSGWLINNGLISSRSEGIFYGGDGAGYITNTGTIQGYLSTWYGASATTAKLAIDNSGQWIGSLGLTPGDDIVTNTGTITGDISLGNGNNSLDSRYGFVSGNVTGGSGVDTILLGAGDTTIAGGAGADTIDGGAGFDIVSYGSSLTGVSINLLNGTASRGDAQGDRLSNIEGLYGSQSRDVLIGDDGNNTINGVLGADTLTGNGGNDTLILLGGSGKALINGGVGNDLIQLISASSATYGYAFNSLTQANGATGYDTLEISDAPVMTFNSLTVRNIDHLVVDDGFNYNFTSNQATVAAGARMWVDGGSLTGTHTFRFDGSAEADGAFDFSGGAYRDTFIGGTGADTFEGGLQQDFLTGGAGADTFIYNGSLDSRFGTRDQITDFDTAADTFQFDVDVTAVDATVSGSVSTVSDLAALVNGNLGASHALLVNVTGGTLGGRTLLIVDGNNTAGLQAADYVIDVTGIAGTLTVADFIMG
jgi:Ca2+-binding RTX toxin-like protein